MIFSGSIERDDDDDDIVRVLFTDWMRGLNDASRVKPVILVLLLLYTVCKKDTQDLDLDLRGNIEREGL